MDLYDTGTTVNNSLINELFEATPEKIASTDIALLNLLCAYRLPGSDDLDLGTCIRRLDHLAEYVRGSIDRTMRAYGTSAQYGHSDAQTRMSLLITRIKQGFGAAYSPTAKADLEAKVFAPFSDASEVFIHGLLHNDRARRWGTCASMPVLITAVARRLGYPVRLAVSRSHCYARWESAQEKFNIEASNAAGMTVPSDEEYEVFPKPLTHEQRRSGYYLRGLSPTEEFAEFMQHRVACLADAARYAETFLWSARALQLAPDDPAFPVPAYEAADVALKHRLRQKYPTLKIPACDALQPIRNILELLAPHEWALMLTIHAHYYEVQGEIARARDAYERACCHHVEGRNEHLDLKRFLKKHNLPPKQRPLMPPEHLRPLRLGSASCRPEEEADILRLAAKEFERKGELAKARNVLHDVYLFDPSDSEVWEGIRRLEHEVLSRQKSGASTGQDQRQAHGQKPQAFSFRKVAGLPNAGPSGKLNITVLRKESSWLIARR